MDRRNGTSSELDSGRRAKLGPVRVACLVFLFVGFLDEVAMSKNRKKRIDDRKENVELKIIFERGKTVAAEKRRNDIEKG